MKGNVVNKINKCFKQCYICVLKSFYSSLPPFSIVSQMYFDSSTGLYKSNHTVTIVAWKTGNCSLYSIEKTYQKIFSYPNTSNFVKNNPIYIYCLEMDPTETVTNFLLCLHWGTQFFCVTERSCV